MLEKNRNILSQMLRKLPVHKPPTDLWQDLEDKLPEEEPQGEGPLDDHDHDDKGQPSSDLIESLIPALQQEILPLLKDEVEEQVKKAITEYCERHFKRLAREVIKEELRLTSNSRANFRHR